jgi:hypothetical protein
MIEMNNYTSFIFSHIPKCGGTSFREFIYKSALHSKIDRHRIYIPGYNNIRVDKNLNQLSQSELKSFSKRKYQVIAMHVPYAIHVKHNNLGHRPLYFSLFREPFERFLSHYYFFYYKQGADGCKGIHLSDLPDNKRLSMIDNLSNIYASYILGNVKSGLYEDVRLLDEVKSKLSEENFHYGLLHDVDKSIDALSNVLPNWLNLDQEFPKVNAYSFQTTYSQHVSEQLIDEFNSRNVLDIQIYEFIKNSLSC